MKKQEVKLYKKETSLTKGMLDASGGIIPYLFFSVEQNKKKEKEKKKQPYLFPPSSELCTVALSLARFLSSPFILAFSVLSFPPPTDWLGLANTQTREVDPPFPFRPKKREDESKQARAFQS